MSLLSDVFNRLNKEYGEQICSVGGNFIDSSNKLLPFSSPRANYMTYGGLPRGRIIEFAGAEGSGKTSSSIDIAANAQEIFQKEYDEEMESLISQKSLNKTQQARLDYLQENGPKQVLFIDAENTFDDEWAMKLGLQVDKVAFYKPQQQCAEEIFEDAINIIDTGMIGLAILDSIGSLVSQLAYSKSIEERTYGGIAMALTLFSKKLAPLCKKTGCTFIGINQVRDNLSGYGGGLTTTGGNAWKHNCSVRIMFQKGRFVDEKGEEKKNSEESPAGNKVMMNIVKTKCFKPDRRSGYYTLSYTDGIQAVYDLFEIALKEGMILKSGAWYNLSNPETGELICNKDTNEPIKLQGKASVIELLDEDIEIRSMIDDYVDKMIRE